MIGPMFEIFGISLFLAVVSQIIQNKFMDKEAMKKHQDDMKAKQKRMKELIGKDDEKSKNELETLEKELMESMQKVMEGSTKTMLFSLVVFLPAFWLLGHFYEKAVIDLPVQIPWFVEGFDLLNISTWGIKMYSQTNWLGWYFLTYLVISMIIGAIVSQFKKASKNQK
jgi:uncharacterized membrane protein (DUF106 family)